MIICHSFYCTISSYCTQHGTTIVLHENVLERAFNPLYSDGVFNADKNNKGGAFLYKGFTG